MIRSMTGRHVPHCIPAPHASPTSSAVCAPERIAARIVASLTGPHWQMIIRRHRVRYRVMPQRSSPYSLMALPRNSLYRSSSFSPALSQMSCAVSLVCGKVLSACG